MSVQLFHRPSDLEGLVREAPVVVHGAREAERGAKLVDDLEDAALGDLEAHAEAARVTARLVAGLQTAAEAIDASVAMAYGGDPFRGMPDDAPVRAARAARVAEVTRIDRQRADRAAHDVRVGLVLAVVVVTPILLAAVC